MHHNPLFPQLLFIQVGIQRVVVLVLKDVEVEEDVLTLIVVEEAVVEECSISATNAGMSPIIVGRMELAHTPVGLAIIHCLAIFGGQLLKINVVDLPITVLVPPEKLGAIL